MKITSEIFGKLKNGKEAHLFELSNGDFKVKITNYGCIVTAIQMPDKNGKVENIVCGFEHLDDYLDDYYLNNYPYFGAIIGRSGNRIAEGKLNVDGVDYDLAINNGPNHLHGGKEGFDKKLWNAVTFEEKDVVGVKMSYTSPHLEENYPGNLQVICTYKLTKENELCIEYTAETDKKTVVNLTNHTYFNLTAGKENILNHYLQLDTDKMTEMIEQIPTGKIVSVENTPFDFRKMKTIVADMKTLPTGYDDNYVFENNVGSLRKIGVLKEKESGRAIEIKTTQPGMQLYTGYWNPEIEKDGKKLFGAYSGVALETQHYPDSVHHANFPSVFLNPGEKYTETTCYKFSTEQ